MKAYISLSCILFLCVSLMSCSEDEDAEVVPIINSSLLIGEWVYYTQEYKDNVHLELPYLVTDCALNRYYKFNSDGTEERYDYESISSINEEDRIENNFVIRNVTCKGEIALRYTRKYEVDGKYITWKSAGGVINKAVIESLDNEFLIIQWNSDAHYFNAWKNRVVFKRR